MMSNREPDGVPPIVLSLLAGLALPTHVRPACATDTPRAGHRDVVGTPDSASVTIRTLVSHRDRPIHRPSAARTDTAQSD